MRCPPYPRMAARNRKSSRATLRGRCAHGTAFAFGRVGEARSDVLARELWEIVQYLVLRHTAREVSQHVTDGDTSASDTRLSESDVGIHRDALEQVHCRSLRQSPAAAKHRLFMAAKVPGSSLSRQPKHHDG